MTEYGAWSPYVGTDAVFLAVTLFAIGVLLTYLGTRLIGAVGIKRPVGKTVSVFMILMWGLSLATFVIAATAYVLQMYQEHMLGVAPTNPISPITEFCGVATFIIIAYLARSHGVRVALGSAFVGTAAAPMIFELPFDLIVMGRTPPLPPAPRLFTLLFFLPLFMVEISTFSLLTLSPLTKLSKYTLFSLAGMFFVFAVWAVFSFSYPSDPIPVALNGTSKILSFIAAITLS